MTGYHYTSLSCWERIQKEGLKPYFIVKPEMYPHTKAASVDGIWVWQERLMGVSHIGAILYQVAMKPTIKVVLLEVQFSQDAIWTEPDTGKRICLWHSGIFGKLAYHTGQEAACIVIDRIPPENIRLVDTYDLLKAWQNGD